MEDMSSGGLSVSGVDTSRFAMTDRSQILQKSIKLVKQHCIVTHRDTVLQETE